jgi:hypothetical protein
MAATNNAAESFNKQFKTFLGNKRYFMKEFIERWMAFIRQRGSATSARRFRFEVTPRQLEAKSVRKAESILQQIADNDPSQYTVLSILICFCPIMVDRYGPITKLSLSSSPTETHAWSVLPVVLWWDVTAPISSNGTAVSIFGSQFVDLGSNLDGSLFQTALQTAGTPSGRAWGARRTLAQLWSCSEFSIKLYYARNIFIVKKFRNSTS